MRNLKTQTILKTILKYITAVIIYAAILWGLLLALDKWIMPLFVADKDPVKVPSVVGLNLGPAIKKLEAAGLKYLISENIDVERSSTSEVLNQVPEAGRTVKQGRKIKLVVRGDRDKVKAPYLIKKTLRHARKILMQKGLMAGHISFEHSENFGKDTVIEQNVQPGAMIEQGEAIDLTVSKGLEAKFPAPDVVGMSLYEAQQAIYEAGLMVGEITYIEDDTYMPMTVVKQFPPPNEYLHFNAPVNITVVKMFN